MNFFYKTRVNNETRMSLRHTWLWRRRNQWSESLKWQSWPRREKVPFLCFATENDTNEGQGSYLSPKMCPLWHFFLNIVQLSSFFLYPDHFYSYIQSVGMGKNLWSSFFEIFGFSNIEKMSKQFFVPFSCLRPWSIKRIIELGLSFSCSLNDEKSFVEHRIILFQIRWTNYGKGNLWSFL